MPDPSLRTAALAALESTVNSALRYDPATRDGLRQLPGVLEIESTTPAFRLYVAPADAGVALLGHYRGEPSTRLRGTLPALLALAAGDGDSLAGSGVDISGSTALLNELRRLLRQLDIDWEEPLCRLLGDIAGPLAAGALRQSFGWLAARGANTERLLAEYLTEELRSLPAAAEVRAFCDDVDDLRLRADRLDARFAQLRQTAAQAASASSPAPQQHKVP